MKLSPQQLAMLRAAARPEGTTVPRRYGAIGTTRSLERRELVRVHFSNDLSDETRYVKITDAGREELARRSAESKT